MRKNPFSRKALLAERNAARREVVISGPTVVPFTSKVWKMSRTSMSVDTVCKLVIGDAVTAKSPGYREILCTVARAAKEHARLRFAKALTDADVLEWVSGAGGKQFSDHVAVNLSTAFPIGDAPRFDDLLKAIDSGGAARLRSHRTAM